MTLISEILKDGFPEHKFIFIENIQALWSGYGSIERWKCDDFSVVVKHVKLPNIINHPKGWNSTISHLRKVNSYKVESIWYENYSKKCSAEIPRLLYKSAKGGSQFIVMDDLNSLGFSANVSSPSENQLKACILWLAEFHACFLDNSSKGLWEVGTYWNLETRPEEFANMADGVLKENAINIDDKLNNCKFKTIVHGDAKLANFCFSNTDQVAAVDFQYVGSGCGMKDLIYLISSVDGLNSFEKHDELIDFYFESLAQYLGIRNLELENEWRNLYKYAWADFNRFLLGWSPDHWKLNTCMDEITDTAILELEEESMLIESVNVFKNAAIQVGDYIEGRLIENLEIDSKGDDLSLASSVVTDVDLKAQALILGKTKQIVDKYNFGILSEELKDDKSRFLKDFFVCIDPLDGTLPFTEKVSGYSVSIALVTKKGESVCGVIYDPRNKNIYHAFKGSGAFKNNNRIRVNYSNEIFTFITDRSFLENEIFEDFVKDLKNKSFGKGFVEFKIIAQGGAVMNSIWCIENAPSIYAKIPKVEKGGGGIWDFAASACIFKELGLKATNFNGGLLDLNRKDSTFMNHEGIWYEV
jgi:fructose-1,6-bisphosphatase/inositol monophosphatase family enzyme